ncbi:TPA: ferrous iron transporter B, partial [Candidatus Micrarchaeota archaeon]|nr:ferrous iron transporter B [Candidatus Micrarchaeota archaeon]
MMALQIALAGNANVGKSALFNYLTGLHQHIGNWPGKTIEKAEGTLKFKGKEINVIDLPGIYSLSTFSTEELVSRDYIARENPDVVVNVLDASVLERNLFFTLQLIELGRPVVVALNMVDIAANRGVKVDAKKLSELLGVPVVPIVATKGMGIPDLMRAVLRASKEKQKPFTLEYRKPVEEKVRAIADMVKPLRLDYPPRWVAVKLLEEDGRITSLVKRRDPAILKKVSAMLKEIGKRCGQPGSVAVSSERYSAAEMMARGCIELRSTDVPIGQKLDAFLLHRFAGYFFLLLAAGASFLLIFASGDFAAEPLMEFLASVKES